MRVAAALLAVALLAVPVAAGPSAGIVAVAPDPVTAGDRGEHVVVAFPERTNLSGWSLADGESVARFPNRTLQGRVVATTDPGAVNASPVVALRGHLALANGGERIALRHRNTTVAAVRYGAAPEGERYTRTEAGWEWRPAGATDRPVVRARNVTVRAFVLPDAPGEVLSTIEAARERILLGGYTFTSRRVADALCAARERGIDVRVLLDDAPVGGLERREARVLDSLARCGVAVSVIGGGRARYEFHHAKYAVIDDRALVLTENWKPAGTGGRSSRGWGVRIDDARVARALAETFRADAGWRDTTAWRTFRRGRRFERGDPPPESTFPARFEPASLRADGVAVLVAPDNAERAIVRTIDGASERLLVQQVTVERDHPFLRATLRAARRGVDVRVLLSGAWYVREGNAALVERLNDLAEREGLALEARLAEPGSRFAKTHVKGVIADDAVVLGSINWNAHATRRNREVAVVLHGAPAAYYAAVFDADWRAGRDRPPIGLIAAALIAALLAARSARTLEFGG